MSLLRSASTWLRLSFRWSNSAQTWHERVGDLVMIGGAVLATAIPFLFSLHWWQILLTWGGYLLLALVLNRLGWVKIFGPVLYYDMVRQARRTRFVVLRFLYALLLVFLLFMVWLGVSDRYAYSDIDVAAEIAQNYFNVFMIAQFLVVALLTPAYVSGAIAEEKDRKTLEFMLATDLLNREIVLSKLGSRLANLALVVLAGLPILSILQFLGGVDPNLVLAGFAVTVMTILGQAGISIYFSVVCRRPRDAIALSYLVVLLYYVGSIVGVIFFNIFNDLRDMPIWLSTDMSPTLWDAFGWYNAGNLYYVIFNVGVAGGSGALAVTLPAIVGSYSLFHGLVALTASALAVARLRRVALAETYDRPATVRRRWRLWSRPAIGSAPMLWKELHCEGSTRASWLMWIVMGLLLAITFVPAALILGEHYLDYYEFNSRRYLVEKMNAWVRTCNVIVGCLTMLAVGVKAATSITSERDRQTLDTLLTTPLDSNAILYAKWFGSLASVRFGMVWLASIWAVGLLSGGLYPAAVPFVVVAWGIYAGFAAALGLWFSTVCRTSVQAIVLTILTMIGASVGHWIVWVCCMFSFVFGGGRDLEHVGLAQAGLLTPPWVMGVFAFSEEDVETYFRYRSYRSEDTVLEAVAFCLAGLVVWSAMAVGLYTVASNRFRQITHRGDTMQSDGQAISGS